MSTERLYDPQHYHPCQGCESLRWDHASLSHGDTVEVPYCREDYHVAVAKCPHYKEEAP